MSFVIGNSIDHLEFKNSENQFKVLGSAHYVNSHLIFVTFLSFLYCSLSLLISSASLLNLSAKKPKQGFVCRNIISFPEKPTGEVVPRRVIPFTLYPPGTRYVSSEWSLMKLSHSWRVVFFRRMSKSYPFKHTILVPFMILFLKINPHKFR